MEVCSRGADDNVVVTVCEDFIVELWLALEVLLNGDTNELEDALPMLVKVGSPLPSGVIVTGRAVIVVTYGVPDDD